MGKTRLALEAAKAFAERKYKEAEHDGLDQAPGSRVVAYAEIQPGYDALLVSKSLGTPSSACAVAVYKAFGMSVDMALAKLSAQPGLDEVKADLKDRGVSCLVLLLDEVQNDLEFTAKVVRGCVETARTTDFKLLPVLSGLRPLRPTKALEGSKWALEELLLTPFQLDGDDQGEDRAGKQFRRNFLRSINVAEAVFEKCRPLQILLQDCGGFPRPTRVLAEKIVQRSSTSGGSLFVGSDGAMDLGVAASIYDEVSNYMARPVSGKALTTYTAEAVDLITDVVLAVLSGIPVSFERNGVGDFSFDTVTDAGIASYVPVDGAGMCKVVMPTFTVIAFAAVLKSHHVLVLPDDPLAMNPFVGGFAGLEVLAMAGLQARLMWWKRRGVRVVQLRDLRPRAVQVGQLDATLRIRVPDSLRLFPRSDELQSVEPGTLQRTSTRGRGLDGIAVLEAEFEEPLPSHKAAGVGAAGAAPASAGGLEPGASRVSVGTVALGMQAKSADEGLAADQPITRLQPNEIQNAVLPKSGPVLQHVRKVLADAGRKLSWVVLDVVSDRESSGDPYEPLHMSAVYYGIDHLMVTTRKQIQESLGPVAASRKRLRGSLQGGGALLASSAGGSGESAQSMDLDE